MPSGKSLFMPGAKWICADHLLAVVSEDSEIYGHTFTPSSGSSPLQNMMTIAPCSEYAEISLFNSSHENAEREQVALVTNQLRDMPVAMQNMQEQLALHAEMNEQLRCELAALREDHARSQTASEKKLSELSAALEVEIAAGTAQKKRLKKFDEKYAIEIDMFDIRLQDLEYARKSASRSESTSTQRFEVDTVSNLILDIQGRIQEISERLDGHSFVTSEDLAAKLTGIETEVELCRTHNLTMPGILNGIAYFMRHFESETDSAEVERRTASAIDAAMERRRGYLRGASEEQVRRELNTMLKYDKAAIQAFIAGVQKVCRDRRHSEPSTIPSKSAATTAAPELAVPSTRLQACDQQITSDGTLSIDTRDATTNERVQASVFSGGHDGCPASNAVDFPREDDTLEVSRTFEYTLMFDETGAAVCVVCGKAVEYYALTPCNHLTCHVCSLKARAFRNDKKCLICRQPAPHMILLEQADSFYGDYKATEFDRADHKLGISYATAEVFEAAAALLQHRCPIFGCEAFFETSGELHHHVAMEHNMVFCPVCDSGEPMTYEQWFEHDGSHPRCGTCKKRVLDVEALRAHWQACLPRPAGPPTGLAREEESLGKLIVGIEALGAHEAKAATGARSVDTEADFSLP